MGNLCLVQSLTPLINVKEVSEIVIVRDFPGPRLPKVKYYCPPKVLSKFSFSRVISKFLLMIYLLIRKKIDIVISYYTKPHGIIALLCAKIFNKPVNLNVMSGPEEFQLLLIGKHQLHLGNFEKFLLYSVKQFDSVTTTGTATKEYLIKRGVAKNKICILPDSIDLDRFYPRPLQKKYDILTVARLVPEKNIETLLHVIANVKKFKRNIKAGIVGDGPSRSHLENSTRNLGIEDNILFLGYKDDVEFYYNSARIFILPSVREGLPMVVLEAMACGVPCIVSNVGDIQDLVIDGFNSVVIEDHNDVNGYTNAIIQLLSNTNYYNRISKNELKTVSEKYSYKNATKVWEDILSKISKENL